ncbi:MAG TPA: aminoglycoside phosphotransferase family protein [Roseiflexaceae bacterium]|nr:aminoglycoside phosphotransferase family protein [Roseiflexaceae bacterium]
MTILIPAALRNTCSGDPELGCWLEQVPQLVDELCERWQLNIHAPFDNGEGSCAWVAPAGRHDGSQAVLKLGMPHMEGEHEIQGLRFWNGAGAAYLFEADEARGALLIERCLPGTILRHRPEAEQDLVIAGLLRRLWRTPPAPHPFRPLATMTAMWADETLQKEAIWPDTGLVRAGLDLFNELPRTAHHNVLLVTDLHAGNVLRATREPWLMIDPKPFVGDPAYDTTQHLLNCEQRMLNDPHATIKRFAELLDLDTRRVGQWMFARAAAESYDDWNTNQIELAHLLRRYAD